jgi:hypothetical protein
MFTTSTILKNYKTLPISKKTKLHFANANRARSHKLLHLMWPLGQKRQEGIKHNLTTSELKEKASYYSNGNWNSKSFRSRKLCCHLLLLDYSRTSAHWSAPLAYILSIGWYCKWQSMDCVVVRWWHSYDFDNCSSGLSLWDFPTDFLNLNTSRASNLKRVSDL